MVDPKVILWGSIKGVVYGFPTNMGNRIKMGTDKLWGAPLLNYVKNSNKFNKFVIELVAL